MRHHGGSARPGALRSCDFFFFARYAGGFHNVRKSAPAPLPSSWRGRIRSENQHPGNSEQEGGCRELTQQERHAGSHQRQRCPRYEICRTADRESFALQWKTPGDPILHSAVYRNGIHATGRSQNPSCKAGSSVTASGNDINALCRRALSSKNPRRRQLTKGNRARPRDVHGSKFFPRPNVDQFDSLMIDEQCFQRQTVHHLHTDYIAGTCRFSILDFRLIWSRDSFQPGTYCRRGTTSGDQSGTAALTNGRNSPIFCELG